MMLTISSYQGYRAKIVDVREEILRKRRAGKLPEGTTTVLKAWWQAHSKWPYPTVTEFYKFSFQSATQCNQIMMNCALKFLLNFRNPYMML